MPNPVIYDNFSGLTVSRPILATDAAFGSGCIQSGALGNNVVWSGQISSGQIGSLHLSSGAVQSGHVASGHIGAGHIAAGAVASGHVASGQISWAHIASGAIRSGHIASGAVLSGMAIPVILSGTVSWVEIAPGTIRSGNIGSGQVGAPHLASGSVQSGHLAVAGTPDGTRFLRDDFSWQAPTVGLTSGAVRSGHIGNAAVTSGNLASGQVSWAHIGYETIRFTNIGSGQIVWYNVADYQIKSHHIGEAQITSVHISPHAVNSGQINFVAVISGNIASGQIGWGHLSSGCVGSGHIGAATVTSGNIASGQVGEPHIALGAVASGHIGSGQLTTFHVASGGLGSGAIGSGQIGWPHLASGSVRSGHIGVAAVVSGNIASGQVGTFHLTSGGVRSFNIASGQIFEHHIALGAVETYHFDSTAVAPFTKARLIRVTTAEDIFISGGQTVAFSSGGLLVNADPSRPGRMPAIGVALGTGYSGQPIDVLLEGYHAVAHEMAARTFVFVGSGGRLTIIPPSSGFIQCMGIVTATGYAHIMPLPMSGDINEVRIGNLPEGIVDGHHLSPDVGGLGDCTYGRLVLGLRVYSGDSSIKSLSHTDPTFNTASGLNAPVTSGLRYFPILYMAKASGAFPTIIKGSRWESQQIASGLGNRSGELIYQNWAGTIILSSGAIGVNFSGRAHIAMLLGVVPPNDPRVRHGGIGTYAGTYWGDGTGPRIMSGLYPCHSGRCYFTMVWRSGTFSPLYQTLMHPSGQASYFTPTADVGGWLNIHGMSGGFWIGSGLNHSGMLFEYFTLGLASGYQHWPTFRGDSAFIKETLTPTLPAHARSERIPFLPDTVWAWSPTVKAILRRSQTRYFDGTGGPPEPGISEPIAFSHKEIYLFGSGFVQVGGMPLTILGFGSGLGLDPSFG